MKIGITIGDPSGVGPEITARTLAQIEASTSEDIAVFGDRGLLERCSGCELPGWVNVVSVTDLAPDEVVPGRPSLAGARAQVAYLEAAIAAARAGEIDALVTAPISKAQVKRVGFGFPGHTELLATRLDAPRYAMMFASPRFKIVLVTIHCGLAEAIAGISGEKIRAVAELAVEALRRDFAIEAPRVGILGINPHAGEGEMFGSEEAEVIEPAMAELRRTLPACTWIGPMAPDSAFRDSEIDLWVAMYHDQGLIPIKLVDFDRAVNVTLGLPIVRTSPDHGVAYDIAGTGGARVGSFRAALDLAIAMTRQRMAATGPGLGAG